MGCRRMLGVDDRAAIMAGLYVGLSQVRIAHLIGRSPSVCREIARHTGPDGEYRAEEAERSRPAMDRDMNLPECIGSYIWGGLLLRHDGGLPAIGGLGECAARRR